MPLPPSPPVTGSPGPTPAQELALLQAILDSIEEGLLVVDAVGRIVRFNQRFAELWRLPQEILSAGDDDRALAFVLDQLLDPEAFLTKVRELYSQPSALSEDILHFKDRRVFERTSYPHLVDGRPTGRIWSFRDVTRRYRSEIVRDAAYRIAVAAQGTGELPELCRAIHEVVRGLMPAENFYIALYDRAREFLSFPYFVDTLEPPPEPAPLGRGCTEYVLRTGRPLLASTDDVVALRDHASMNELSHQIDDEERRSLGARVQQIHEFLREFVIGVGAGQIRVETLTIECSEVCFAHRTTTFEVQLRLDERVSRQLKV